MEEQYQVYYQVAKLTEDRKRVAYYLGSESFSEYYQRRSKWDREWKENYKQEKPAPDWKVYGLEQAKQHLEERQAEKPGNYVIIKTTKTILTK